MSGVPLWTLNSPTLMQYDLVSDNKAYTDPIVYKTKYRQVKTTYYNFERIHTDGSKNGKRTAVSDGYVITFRLPEMLPFYLMSQAILLMLNYIESEGYWRYIILPTHCLLCMHFIMKR